MTFKLFFRPLSFRAVAFSLVALALPALAWAVPTAVPNPPTPGPVTINEGQTINFDGFASSPGPNANFIVAYVWYVDGNPVSQGPIFAYTPPTVPGPNPALHNVALQVIDDENESHAANVAVTVNDINEPPVVGAGPDRNLNEGTTTTLQGSYGDPNNDPIQTIQWSSPNILNLNNLDDLHSLNPTFTAPPVAANTTYEYTLTITDARGLSGSDTVLVNVANVNAPPTASAGPDITVVENTQGTLHGVGGDPDGFPAGHTFLWERVSGPQNIVITNATSQDATFQAPNVVANETYVFRFSVTDPVGPVTVSDTMNVTVSNQNVAPTAVNLSTGTAEDVARAFLLTGSDPDPGTTLTFTIATPPAHGALTGTPPNVNYRPAANYNGPDSFTFTVTDNGTPPLTSPAATVTINVSAVDDAPVANAGPNLTVIESGSIQFQGSATDVDGADPITFLWEPATGLSNPNIPNPVYTAPVDLPAEQTFSYTLKATGSGGTTTSSMTVRVTNGLPPEANAGLTDFATEFTTVTLLGSGIDADNQLPLTFLWTQIAGTSVTITNPTDRNATFIAPSVNSDTSLTFRLTVRDAGGNTGISDVTWIIRDVAEALPVNAVLSNLVVYPSPFTASRGATIRYDLRAASEVKILIVDVFGKVVRELGTANGGAGGVAGTNIVPWDGKNGEGEFVGNGAYVVQVRSDDGAGQKGKINERVGVRN